MEDGKQDPRVRFSLLWKITLPLIVLAVLLGLGANYAVDRELSQEQTDRLLGQLVDSSQQAKDAIVRAEVELLELERTIANLGGVAESAATGDAEDLRSRVLPLALNARADVVAVLDTAGTGILTIRRLPDASLDDYETLRGEGAYADWPFVQRVLSGVGDELLGDRHAGMHPIVLNGVEHQVLFFAGPLQAGESPPIGGVLVGRYTDLLAASVSDQAGANVSLYGLAAGRTLSSTLEPTNRESIDLTAEELAELQTVSAGQSPVRSITLAGTEYWELLTPLLVRQDTEMLGIIGISLARVPGGVVAQNGLPVVVRFGIVGLALVALVGLQLSKSIIKPLGQLVEASERIAQGDLDTQVPEGGSDEIGLLAASFNRMVGKLRQSAIYRDLLGRSASPEVQDQLRTAITVGSALLKGQRSEATILFADFHGYSPATDSGDPGGVMQALNDYFSGVAPIIALHGGVVNRFDGDRVMASFGILPQYLPPRVSSLKATHAGLAMLEHIHKLNQDRRSAGRQAFEIGIGVATGLVIAGGLGSEDRLHYTVVGDTVTTARRIQQVTSSLGGTLLVISENTYRKLGPAREQFEFGWRGPAQLKGKGREEMVYEVRGRKSNLVADQQLSESIKVSSASLPRITQILSGKGPAKQPAEPSEADLLEQRLIGRDTGPLPDRQSGEETGTPPDRQSSEETGTPPDEDS